jgi:Fe-S-cluster containining protein
MNSFKRKGSCPPQRCKGQCCSFLGFSIPVEGVDTNPIEEFYRTRGVKMINDGDVLSLFFDQKCQHLTDEGLCAIYDSRPQVCRDFPVHPSNLRRLNCGFYFERAVT